MTPPHVPGYPGTPLPAPWASDLAKVKKTLEELTARVAQLELDAGQTRQTLQSINDEDEDSQVTIPTDAPPRAKVILGFASGLTPTGRLVIGLALIAALTLLLLRGVKLL